MYLSHLAQQLLNAGNIRELQALTYEELLPEGVRLEILNSFLNPQHAVLPGDSVAQVMLDPTSYESLTNTCTLSSGQIFSQATVEALINSRRGGTVNCPITRTALNLNIGGTGLAYIMLPKIDEVIRGYRTLYAAPPTPSDLLSKSFNPLPLGAIVEKTCGTHSAMPALHFTPLPPKPTRTMPTAPPLILEQDIPVGTLEVKVARNKLRIVVTFSDSSENVFPDEFKKYLNAVLPNSQVIASSGSYSMNKECFGRCWKMRNNRIFDLDLWFPPHTSTLARETFGDHHLNKLLKQFLSTLGLLQVTPIIEEAAAGSIAAIAPRVYVIAMEAKPATYKQMISCCQIFLNRTQVIASNLHIPINDTVITHNHTVAASITSGFNTFGKPDDTASSSSFMSAVPFGNPKG